MVIGTYGKSLRLAGLLAALALVAGCEKSVEDVVAEKRAPVEAVFAKISALADTIDGSSPLTADAFDLGGAKVVLEGEGKNALFIQARDIGDPVKATDDGFGELRAGTVATCAEALRGEFYGAGKGAAMFLDECAAAEYVFVLRTLEESYAEIIGSDTFNPGVYVGEVRLFRLADGAELGGFTVQAENSDTVTVQVDSAGNPIDPIPRLNEDLGTSVFSVIEEKLRTHVPGSLPAT